MARVMDVLYRFPTNEPPSSDSDRKKGPGRWRHARLLAFLVVAGFVVGIAFKSVPGASKADSPVANTTDIKSLVIKTALHRPEDKTQPSGGVLGPWWIHASGSEGGNLIGLCLEGSDAHVAAARAEVLVDADENSLSFLLMDAVIVTLPGEGDEGLVERHDSIQLGPIPMSIDIVSESNELDKPYS